jgi:Protein of unknown function (DUF4236)
MGFRFFRRKKIAPGVTLNVSKSGPSLTVGTTGAKHTVGPRGSRTTVGIPGTGISYSKQHGAASAVQPDKRSRGGEVREYVVAMDGPRRVMAETGNQIAEWARCLQGQDTPGALKQLDGATTSLLMVKSQVDNLVPPTKLREVHTLLVNSFSLLEEGLQGLTDATHKDSEDMVAAAWEKVERSTALHDQASAKLRKLLK